MSEQFFPTRDGNLARFERVSQLNGRLTRERRTSVYDEVTLMIVTSPGLTKTEFVCEIHRAYPDGTERRNELHWDQYGDLFEQWQKGAAATVSGTPLEAWDGVRQSERAGLQRLHIRTVEQLANAPDTALDHIGMGARALREKARAFVAAGPAGELQRLREELEEMRKQLAETPRRRRATEPDPVAAE